MYMNIVILVWLELCLVVKPQTLYHHEKNIINDIIYQLPEKTNLVLIVDQRLSGGLDMYDKNISFIYVNFYWASVNLLRKIKQYNDQENVQCWYMIIATNYRLQTIMYQLILNIRKVDYLSPVFAFYRRYSTLLYYRVFKLYNVFHIVPSFRIKHMALYTIKEVCQFCLQGQDTIRTINSYDYYSGFKTQLMVPSSFKNNFFGKPFSLTCYSKAPYIYMTEEDFATNNANGMDWVLLNLLGRHFNYHFQVQNMRNMRLIGLEKMVSYVYYRRADIGGCGINNYVSRFANVMDVSPVYMTSERNIISAKPDKSWKWYSFVKPVSVGCWCSIMATVISASFVLHLTRKLLHNKSNEALGKSLFEASSILLSEGIQFSQLSISAVIHLSVYMLLATVLINAYMGSLTSFLITPQYSNPPIDSVQQWLEHDMKLILSDGESTPSGLTKENVHRLPYRSTKNRLAEIIFQMIVDNPTKYVEYTSRGMYKYVTGMYFRDINGHHPFYISKNRLRTGYIMYMFKKESTYIQQFNHKILQLIEAGIVKYVLRKQNSMNELIFQKNAVKHKRYYEEQSGQIQIIHISGGLVILAIGFIAALIVFVTEIADEVII